MHLLFKLRESQRTVVLCARQTETEIDKLLLPRLVAVVHRPQLRHRDMRFIDYRKEIFGEIVQQTFRRLACRPAGQRTRIVLDAVAVSKFAHHLNVVLGTLPDALSLYVFLRPLEIPETFRKLILNALVRRLHLLLRHDELLGWSYDHSRHRHTRLASNRIKRAD